MKKVIFLIVFISLSTNAYSQLYAFIANDGTYGYKDANGNIIIPAQYEGGTEFNNGYAFVVLNKKLSKINSKGEAILTYSGAYLVSDNVYVIYKNEEEGRLYGIINPYSGKEISPLKYNDLVPMSEHLLQVGMKIGNSMKVGLLDRSTGLEILPPIYDSFYPKYNLPDKYYHISKDEKKGVLNKYGKIMIPPIYDQEIAYFKESNPIPAYKNGKGGYVDSLGNVIIPFIYDELKTNPFLEKNREYAIASKNNKYGIISPKGSELTPFIYDYIGSPVYDQGLFSVRMNEKWGFIDVNGKLVVPIIYEKVESFSEGFAVVRQNGKYGYINNKGSVVIPIKYKFALPWRNGKGRIVIEQEEKITSMNMDRYTYSIDASGKIYK